MARMLIIIVELDVAGFFLKCFFFLVDFLLEGLFLFPKLPHLLAALGDLILIRLDAFTITLMGRTVLLFTPTVIFFLATNSSRFLLVEPVQFIVQLVDPILIIQMHCFLGANGVAD